MNLPYYSPIPDIHAKNELLNAETQGINYGEKLAPISQENNSFTFCNDYGSTECTIRVGADSLRICQANFGRQVIK